MCFPGVMETMAAIGTSLSTSGVGTALGLAGAGLSTIGAIQSANMQAAGLEAQAAFNQRQAQLERDKGDYEASRASEQARRVLARQQANFMASGVALEGTPSLVIEDTTAETELDIAAIRYGSEIKAGNLDYQARINRMNAGQARAAGPLNALTAGITGLTRIASPYRLA